MNKKSGHQQLQNDGKSKCKTKPKHRLGVLILLEYMIDPAEFLLAMGIGERPRLIN